MGCIKHGVASWSEKVILPLYLVLVWNTGCSSELLNVKTVFRLDMKKNFITVRMVKHCNKLQRKVIVASDLPVFKRHFDNALLNVWLTLKCSDTLQTQWGKKVPLLKVGTVQHD